MPHLAYAIPFVVMSAALAGVVAVLPGVWFLDDDFDRLCVALPWSLIAAVLYAGLWCGSARARKSGLRQWSLLAGLSFVAAIPAGFAAQDLANVLLDAAPVELRRAPLLRTESYAHGNDPERYAYFLVVPSWRAGREEERIQVRRALVKQVEPGMLLEIALQSGRLGWAWYSRDDAGTPGFVGLR